MTAPKIGLLGIALESNAFAPVATEQDFRDCIYLEGEEVVTRARQPIAAVQKELQAFVQAMDVTGPWQPVGLLDGVCPPWGPVDQKFFDTCLDRIDALIEAAGRLDGVYVANHGAMVATEDGDPDGTMLAQLRSALGPDVPIIVTLDLHGNISERMAEAADSIIGYRTNPHVDQKARGEEAAFVMRQTLSGAKPVCTVVKPPLAPPSVTLLTADGPYADLMDYGQRRAQELTDDILNVSVFGGFVFSDSHKTGLSVVVTAREDRAKAQALAEEIAGRAWKDRDRFKRELTSIEDAVAMAAENAAYPVLPARIYSDAGDNPGGGGEGRTTWLLDALIAGRVKFVLYGSFFDPALAAEAHEVGLDSEFEARFNRDFESEFSKPLTVPAKVVGLHDGGVVGRLGIYRDVNLRLGPCAALRIGGREGVTVVVISARHQTADPIFFEMFGLNIAEARTVVVKSRGHFRAGFAPWFPPDTVCEVDTAGLTSPVLSRFSWENLPRPVFPLDEETKWDVP